MNTFSYMQIMAHTLSFSICGVRTNCHLSKSETPLLLSHFKEH